MAYRDSLCSLIAGIGASRVAEIGVHRGRTSAEILRRFPDVTLYMVDHWQAWLSTHGEVTQGEQDEFYRQAIRNTDPWKDRRVIVREHSNSVQAITAVPECDLVFIDGNHSYEAVHRDMGWIDGVRSGGIFCGHDYNENHPGVIKAVDEYFSETGFNVAEGSIWWITKA